MTFPFTVEDGAGLSNATSYVSVEDADDILIMNIHAAPAWMALSLDVKQRLLSWASRYLDERARWFGRKTVETAALRFPRSGVRDRDGIHIDANEIPRQLRVATAEMARYLIDADRTVERDQDALISLKADVVEMEFVEGYRLPKVPEHVGYLLQGLGSIGAGFKAVIR